MSSTPAVDWIVFDLGNVIIPLDPAYRPLILDHFTPRDPRLEELLLDHFVFPKERYSLNELYQIGKLTTEEFFGRLSSSVGNALSAEELRTDSLRYLLPEDPSMLGLLRRLSATHRLACFSNTHAAHWEHIEEKYECLKHFRVKVASHLIGAAKPDPESFRLLSESLGSRPAQILFIDDRIQNVDGARSAGMNAVQFTGYDQLVTDLESAGIII